MVPGREVGLRQLLAVHERVDAADGLHDARLRLLQQLLVGADDARQGRLADLRQLLCNVQIIGRYEVVIKMFKLGIISLTKKL